MYSILKKEINSYFNTFVGYLAIAIYHLLTGLLVWVFPDSSIIDNGYATLESFFALSPYLLMMLIPAITMQCIAGEKANGTYDLLLSKPVKFSDIILGKFFGAYTISLLALLPTAVYAICLYYISVPIGNIDIGGISGSYLGLFLLALAFTALSLFCSTLTNNVIIAFFLASILCFFSYYGIGALDTFLTLYGYNGLIENVGIQFHYDAMSRGVIEGSDVIYFFSFVVLFLILSIGHIGRKYRRRKQTLTVYVIVIGCIILFNNPLIFKLIPRIDFTEDKRFTLSSTSKETLSKIDEIIHITIFLDGDLPSGFKRLKNAAVDMAQDMSKAADKKIKVHLINPQQGSQEEQQQLIDALIDRGLPPTNLSIKTNNGISQKLIFPYAIVNIGDKEININLLQQRMGIGPDEVLNNSIQNIEYAYICAIQKLIKTSNSYIGFTEGHGEPSDAALYDAMQSFSSTHQVGRVNLDSIQMKDLLQFSLLVIAKPEQKFSESDKYKLDYFIRHGGAVIWAIDQVNANLDNMRQNGQQILLGKELNLDDQLFLYGVRLNYDIIADLNCTQIPLTVGNFNGQNQVQLAPWPYYPIIMPIGNHPMIKNLDGIRTEFIGSIDTIANMQIKKEILLHSSPYNKIYKTGNAITLQQVEGATSPKDFQNPPKPIAVVLSGKFPYLFQDRPTPNGIDHPKDLTNISKDAKMLVIADGDWLINHTNNKDGSPYPLGWDKYTDQQFANKIFWENAVEYLTNEENILSLRNREIKLRLLNPVVAKQDKVKWQLINVAAPLLLLTLAGLIQQWIRKRKYTKKAA